MSFKNIFADALEQERARPSKIYPWTPLRAESPGGGRAGAGGGRGLAAAAGGGGKAGKEAGKELAHVTFEELSKIGWAHGGDNYHNHQARHGHGHRGQDAAGGGTARVVGGGGGGEDAGGGLVVEAGEEGQEGQGEQQLQEEREKREEEGEEEEEEPFWKTLLSALRSAGGETGAVVRGLGKDRAGAADGGDKTVCVCVRL